MEQWEIDRDKAKAKKEREAWLLKNVFGYEDKGRTVYFHGEYGVLVLHEEGERVYMCIRWDTKTENDLEEYSGGNWLPTFIDTPYEFKYINQDGTLK